jgi:polyhydroxyalkanoate synthase
LPETEESPLPDALAQTLAADRALIAGIAAYRADSYTRQVLDPPCLWEEGESRLLDYGGEGPSVLFVPSLINRAYILDLMEEASMLRWLSAHGVHPYLLDWGWPGEAERRFSLTDYIAGRLERAIAALPGKVVLAGYCMGGLLALAAALRLPEKISALALLATPWDFHADDPAAAKRIGDMVPALEFMMGFSSTLPIDALNALFAMIDPYGVGAKYRDFAGQDKASARARRFVAMEDWLADGVPLAAPVAREALDGWYGANSPARLQWRVAGLPVDPARLTVPAFCAIPARDRLVPAASAQKLAASLRQASIIEPRAGHIGMVAGTHAKSALWQPFTDWLHGL